MASGQSDNQPSTYPPQRAGVKRTRAQEHHLARKSARLEASHHDEQQKPASRKRSRTQNDLASPEEPSEERRKRPRGPVKEARLKLALQCNLSEDNEHPIAYWAANKRWPRKYFQKGKDMENILARKRSISARSRKNSDADSATPSSNNQSEQTTREQKSAEYKKPQYATLLAIKGVLMEESEMDISQDSKRECRRLLEEEGEIPEHSLFRDDLFKATCRKIQDKNEARVIQDITRLIVPSAETLHTYGAMHLQCLVESVNESWNNSIPITKTRPQPDYAVGFRREAFTQEQLDRMHPVVGDFNDQSYFMATWYMYFPFLTCEVKCGAAALDVADRQNAHSAAIAVRAVVELFRVVKREKELHREILAFSISHDHCSIRIYGHYVEFNGAETRYYRHTIHKFDFTAMDGKEKWTAYKFTKNVYDKWMPKHFERISSAIDQIPADISFSVSQHPESSGLSQDFSAYSVAQSSFGSASEQPQDDIQSSISQDPVATPGTSVHEGAPFKIPRKERARRGRK